MVRPSMGTPSSIGGTMGLYPRSAPFFDAFPSSTDGLRQSATNNDESQSKTMGWVTADVVLAPWEDNQHRELFDGQLVFAVPLDYKALTVPGHRSSAARLQMPLLNLRHVNTFLRVGYALAQRDFQSQKGAPPRITEDFSSEELQLMASRPVRCWHNFDFLQERFRASGDDSAVKNIVYLSERLILERFNVYGWIHGQVPVDGRLPQVAVRRAGTIDDAENIWSSDVFPGDNLYLILKRVVDPATNALAQFAYIPWFGPGMPSLEECAYTDVNDNPEYGCAIYIGSVDRLTHDHYVRPDELPQLIGIKPCTLQRVRVGPEPGCLRITSLSSKNKLPWAY